MGIERNSELSDCLYNNSNSESVLIGSHNLKLPAAVLEMIL